MNHAGESVPAGFPVDLTNTLDGGRQTTGCRPGNGQIDHKPALAIVGSHSATRELAPYDDPRFEIWLFNEAAQKTEVYRRWDALLQLHKPEVYSSAENWVNKDHWHWLQQDQGDGLHGRRRIFMINVDPRVPNSVKYPLEDVLSLVPYHYLRSSVAEALALAIHLGYREIWLYGSELSSNTEYAYQATNYAFWIGFAHGRGIDLHLECWQSEFNQPLYGYEGETQIEKGFFEERCAEYEKAWKHNEFVVSKLRNAMENAMLKAKFDRVGELSLNIEQAAMSSGEAYGIMSEAKRYLERANPISDLGSVEPAAVGVGLDPRAGAVGAGACWRASRPVPGIELQNRD